MKNIILWNYERGTWQYDVFCLLIIAFIFLTPNSWFDKREKLATQTSRLIVKSEDFSPEKDKIVDGERMKLAQRARPFARSKFDNAADDPVFFVKD